MNTHILKCWPVSFEPIVTGQKKLELRRNDRAFQVGDQLMLLEFIPCVTCNGTGRMWDNGDKCACVDCDQEHGKFTDRKCLCVVTHILPGGQFGLAEGFVAMSIQMNVPLTVASQ